ncbi:fumarylacetoacetate hydrolase family protein [Pollutimonas subterranea]|nr:fumarylacetoacetate hydrolase family protein [Pollutimonas subterranea]
MRFVTFLHEGKARAGVIHQDSGDRLIDGGHPSRPAALQGLEPDMMAWIRFGLERLSHELSATEIAPECLLPLSAVKLLAPLRNPGKIVGAAFNYKDGLVFGKREFPAEPVIFVKSMSTVIGPDDIIEIDTVNQVTYEAELAVVIGRQALKVSRDDAMDYVSGYVIFNDVSTTNYVREDGGFVRGKNQPTSGPLGPWIRSCDDISDPYALAVTLDVDGRRLQDSNTSQMLYRIDELIEYASARMPLDLGDIIATGTPVGVAANHEPPAWLMPGMRVSARLEGLGQLNNIVAKREL